MPDIVSRIKIEATGADQAARDIRKLRDAYNEVGAAAKKLSPNAAGADPFAAAVSAPGGGIVGGQRSPADVIDSQRRNDEWRDTAESRLRDNKYFPTSHGGAPAAYGGRPGGGGLQNMVGNAFGAGNQLDQGQGLGAAGTGLKALAGLLTGPGAIALGVAGAVAYGTQQLAAPAIERRERLWNSGIVQRTGSDYTDSAHWEALMATKGVAPAQAQAFLSAGSNTGFSWGGQGANVGAQAAMMAAKGLGLEGSTSAGLLGAMNLANMDMSLMNANKYGALYGSFGAEGVGRGVAGLTQMVSNVSGKGVQLTPEAFQNSISLMTGLSSVGGLSVDAATGLTNRLTDRGIAAAGLNTPEDLLALSAMRASGMSVTEAQIAMEQNPGQVTQSMYDVLQRRYAGDEDSLNYAMMKYTGGTMSETVALRNTLDSGGTYEDYIKTLPTGGADAEISAALNQKIMFGAQEGALNNIVASLGKGLAEFRGGLTINPSEINFGDRMSLTSPIVVAEAETVIVSANVLKDNPATRGNITGMAAGYGLDISSGMEAFWQGGTGAQLLGGVGMPGEGESGVYGGWDELGIASANAIIKSAMSKTSTRQERNRISGAAYDFNPAFDPSLYSNMVSEEEVVAVLRELLAALSKVMPVATDGDE